MRLLGIGVLALAALALAGSNISEKSAPIDGAVSKGAQWLVSVQGKDGGWGQDGGETSYNRKGERLESTGNDVANTAVAALALLRAGNTPAQGPQSANLRKALEFILRSVEASAADGLAITAVTGSQIQRKLGPYIDTFLTTQLLAEVDGAMGAKQENARVHAALEKCVRKIEKNQLKDGSWNVSGGWAPILSTSMASRGLYAANAKVAVDQAVMARVDDYTKRTAQETAGAATSTSGPRASRTYASAASTVEVAAGVPLYKKAQELEQLSRDEKSRRANSAKIAEIQGQLKEERFVQGFGSVGGEEYFSYLNISDSMRRTGGDAWKKWNQDTQAKILKVQNNDGSWVGHHCITGRVAVTGAAMLTLLVERTPAK